MEADEEEFQEESLIDDSLLQDDDDEDDDNESRSWRRWSESLLEERNAVYILNHNVICFFSKN